MEGMVSYTQAAVERAMTVQEVILRAMAKKITWWQAAEIIGISDRQMRRWHTSAAVRSSTRNWRPASRLREINPKPDISLATKSGRFNLLTTGVLS
jgi:hypothetical protein